MQLPAYVRSCILANFITDTSFSSKTDYPNKIKITDVKLKFQSSLNIDNSDILLSDVPEKNLRTDKEGKSIIVFGLDEIQAHQIFSSVIDCSFPKGDI